MVGMVAAGLLAAGAGFSQTTLGTVRLPRAVLEDGRPLAAGTYRVRLTDEHVTPVAGESPDSERWVEFVMNGTVAGREVATVISANEVGAVVKDPAPKANGARVDVLKGGDYLRVWINRKPSHYIVNLPIAR
jgi:hypothetical protein